MRTVLAASTGAALLALGLVLLLSGGGGTDEFGWFAYAPGVGVEPASLMVTSRGRLGAGLLLTGVGVAALGGVVGHGLAGSGRGERTPYVAAVGVVLLVVGVPLLLGPGSFLADTGGFVIMSGHRFGAGVLAGAAGLALLAGAIGHRAALRTAR